MPITREARKGFIEPYKRGEMDTGSSEVQIAVLTQRIQSITNHLAGHKKDHATRRGLLMMVGKRNNLLKYLARKSPERYQKLIDSLGLRK
jgi:small subunit ribosomal protein S15